MWKKKKSKGRGEQPLKNKIKIKSFLAIWRDVRMRAYDR